MCFSCFHSQTPALGDGNIAQFGDLQCRHRCCSVFWSYIILNCSFFLIDKNAALSAMCKKRIVVIMTHCWAIKRNIILAIGIDIFIRWVVAFCRCFFPRTETRNFRHRISMNATPGCVFQQNSPKVRWGDWKRNWFFVFSPCWNGLLGGGHSFLNFFTPIWGDDPIWRAYFSDGLKSSGRLSVDD